jgi:hypothetical protein
VERYLLFISQRASEQAFQLASEQASVNLIPVIKRASKRIIKHEPRIADRG